ncbi:hypothetical protein U2F10_23330 [Leptothoe sp. EHU-05/26/07-4]
MALTEYQKATIFQASKRLGNGYRTHAVAYVNNFVNTCSPEAAELLIASINQFSHWKNLIRRHDSTHVR